MAESKTKTKAEAEAATGEATEAAPKSSGKKKIIIIAVLLIAASAGGYFMMAGKGAEEEGADKAAAEGGEGGHAAAAEATVEYVPIDPPLVVNIPTNEEARFLQVSMEVKVNTTELVEVVKKHMPAIRNSLVFLLSNQTYETLITSEGKKKVLADSLAEINGILKENGLKEKIESIYYTGFVMQ